MSDDYRVGRAASKRGFKASCARFWWPRRQDEETDEDRASNRIQRVNDFSPFVNSTQRTENEFERVHDLKKIYILGAGNLGTFIAHSLAGIPSRPPIVLLLKRRQSDCFSDCDRSIDVTTRGVTETRRGFEVEIISPPSPDTPLVEENLQGADFPTSLKVDFKTNVPQSSSSPQSETSSEPKPHPSGTAVTGPSPDCHQTSADNNQLLPYLTDVTLRNESHYNVSAAKEWAEGAYIPFAQIRSEQNMLDSEAQIGDEESDEAIVNIIVSVKAPQTLRALQAVAHRLTRDSTILFMQNGMGIIDEVTSKLFPDERYRPTYIVGVVSHGLYSDRIFSIVHAGEGTIALGAMPRMPMTVHTKPDKLSQLAPSTRYLLRTMTRTPALVAVGFTPTDLLQQQLDKLAVNCIINPLTAILECRNGVLLSNFHFTRVMRLLLAEISLVIKNLPELKNVPNVGMRFDTLRLERLVFAIAKTTAGNNSSMLQDLRVGKETEVDYINGYIVKRGEEMGVHCVMNYMLIHMIKGKRKISQENTDGLPFGRADR